MKVSNSVWRYDKGQIGKARATPEGFLHVPATVTRVGVFKYQMANGQTRLELRPPEEVLSKSNLASIARSVITNEHPAGGKPVTIDNVRALSIGHADSEVTVDGGLVNLGLTLTDKSSIKEVLSRSKTEVSCGYRCRIDHVSGVWRGLTGDGEPEPYDVIQRGHENNHIALTKRARGGPDVRLHLDSDDAEQIDEHSEREPMKINLIVDGQGVELDPSVLSVVKSAIDTRDAKIKADSAELSTGKKKFDELQAKYDTLEEEAKKAKSDSVSPEDVSKLVKSRMRLLDGALLLLPKDALTKLDAVDDVEVMRIAVRANTPLKLDADPASEDHRSDDYVRARFDSLAEKALETAGNAGIKKLAAGAVNATGTLTREDSDTASIDARIVAAQLKADNKYKGGERKEVN